MSRVIEMPKLSDTMEEGGIANWLKKEGDSVREGEPLVEIETDKATQEFESPEEGVLLKILVSPGKTVALRTPIAVIGAKGEKVDLAAISSDAAKVVDLQSAKKASQAAAAKGPAVGGPPSAGRPSASAGGGQQSASAAGSQQPASGGGPQAAAAGGAPAPKPAAAGGAPAPQRTDAAADSTGDRLRSSPLARKMAADKGVDLHNVHGSGPGGRIVMRDIEAAPAGGAASASAAAPAGVAPASAAAYGGPGAGATAIPVSMMRKTIAKRLLAAKNEAPHFYVTVSANLARLESWRKELNDEAAKADGKLAKVSVNDLVILAVSRALRRHPMVNSSWQGDTILQNHQVHVALAVALPEGLVTPVIRNTDVLGVREIAAQARELAAKAKDGKLANDAYAGGTFTISNLGMFGVEEFTAIINPPQAAILAVGAAVPTPWADERGQLVVQQRMKMTLSCDHRVVDGALGAQFLKTLVSFLEEPMRMMV